MREEIKEKEPKCVNCGKSEFKLWRTLDSQIVAECIHCEEPHLLDALDEEGIPKILHFWSPKIEEEKT